MNILLWILQALLALHTVVGAVWKFSNAPPAPSLGAIPHGAWLALSVIEILCAIALVVPALRGSIAVVAPIAAACIAIEMLVFCVLHMTSGDPNTGPLIYWLVVAILCAFIAYGRFVLKR
jgi:hypothetical protein